MKTNETLAAEIAEKISVEWNASFTSTQRMEKIIFDALKEREEEHV